MRVIGSNVMRVVVTVLFAVVMSCASVCSAMCAAGICPNEMHAGGEDCDHMLPSHAAHPEKPAHDEQDCTMGHRSTFNLLKADSLPQFQLAKTGRIDPDHTVGISTQVTTVSLASFSITDLAPPPTLGNSHFQRTSVLRI